MEMSRREVLRLGGAAAAAGAGYYGMKNLGALGVHVESQKPSSFPERRVHESKAKAADLASAGVVVGAFLHTVVWNGALKETVTGKSGESLGPKSAATMMALEGGRIALLSSLGGEYDQRGKDELHELFEGVKLVPALVALSDASTRALRIDPDKLLGRETAPLQLPPRPSLEQPDLHHWELHGKRLEQALTRQVADIIAIASALAPLVTTYASSATADRMKESVLKTLHELTYARLVVGQLRQDEQRFLDKAFLEEVAAKEANELFNGAWGFSKLILTMTSDVLGSWGIGDPPEIFAAMRHKDKPGRLLRAHAFGIANSETHALEGAMLWLKKAGVELHGAQLQMFVQQQGAVFSSVTKTAYGALRRSQEKTTSPIGVEIGDYLRVKRDAAKSVFRDVGEKGMKLKTEVGRSLLKMQEDPKAWFENLLSGRIETVAVGDEKVDLSQDTSFEVFQEAYGTVQDPGEQVLSTSPEVFQAAQEVIQQAMQTTSEASSGQPTHDEAVKKAQDVLNQAEREGFLSHGAKEVLWALLTQVPVVAPAARLASEAVPKICGIKEEVRPTAKQAKEAVGAYLFAVIAMSAFADNVAAYMFGEESIKQFFETYYGEHVFEHFPHLGDLVTIAPLKLAEQAGALTKVGNGPNFAQRKLEIAIQNGTPQVQASDMTLQETFQNRFAQLANTQLFLASMGAFSKAIDELYKKK